MVVEPKIMLFDEPLSNLDAKLRVQTRIEIRNLLKQLNITAIYVTHDQEEALTISDWIAVMNKGRIEQLASPTELYSMPKTKFVADFIGHANLLEGVVEKISEGHVEVMLQNGILVHCISPAKIHVGDKRFILVRPENINLFPVESTEENLFDAVVEERNFLGSVVRYKVRLASGIALECEIHPDYAFAEVRDAVKVQFNKEKMVLVG